MTNNVSTPSTLILGASRGIGAAIAERFLEAGHTVTATHRGSGVAQGARGVFADLTSPDSLAGAVAQTLEQSGRIDNLVVAGGITRDALLLRQTPEQLNEVIETNLLGPIHATKAVLKSMLKAKAGSIVLVGSVSARLGVAGQTNYTAAKAGVEGFMHSFSREYASRGIRINVVAPGPTETEMLTAIPAAELDAMKRSVPLGRLAQPREIADVVYWVSQSTFMTGVSVPVAGGLQIGY